MRPTLSGGTSPMNFSVTCIPSTCAQRAPRQFFSNWPIRLRIASRTSSGISSATKTRNCVPSTLDCQLSTLDSAPCFFSLRSPSILLLPLLRIQEVPPHQVQGCLRSLPADAIAVASAGRLRDRKSTRLNSSHVRISYAVFCLKKKKTTSGRIHHQDT